jgi:hypothetical protein
MAEMERVAFNKLLNEIPGLDTFSSISPEYKPTNQTSWQVLDKSLRPYYQRIIWEITNKTFFPEHFLNLDDLEYAYIAHSAITEASIKIVEKDRQTPGAIIEDFNEDNNIELHFGLVSAVMTDPDDKIAEIVIARHSGLFDEEYPILFTKLIKETNKILQEKNNFILPLPEFKIEY